MIEAIDVSFYLIKKQIELIQSEVGSTCAIRPEIDEIVTDQYSLACVNLIK